MMQRRVLIPLIVVAALTPLAGKASAQRVWQVEDVIETARITATAARSRGKKIAYIVREPSIEKGEDKFTLYVAESSGAGRKKLLQSTYIAALQSRPGSASWTVLAEIGKGVQLYEIDDRGRSQSLLVNQDLAPVGGNDGLVASVAFGSRPTGVLAYGWSRDGGAFWYKKLRLRNQSERAFYEDNGVVYDEGTTALADFHYQPPALATELHMVDAQGRDRLVAAVPANRYDATSGVLSINWTTPNKMSFVTMERDQKGVVTFVKWIADLATGRTTHKAIDGISQPEAFQNVRSAEGRMVIRSLDGERRLVAIDEDESVRRDYGAVDYEHLISAWRDEHTDGLLLSVRYADHYGLVSVPATDGGKKLALSKDHLESCSFDESLTFGVCSRESFSRPPELVAIDPVAGEIRVIGRPNARYDAIPSLRTEAAEWTNRFGFKNSGYITYPRNYQSGLKYPALVITHSRDAQNRFAYQVHQWHFPAQAFAERGYFVLSVNEPIRDAAAVRSYGSGMTDTPIQKMQFAWVYNSVASMEAAAQSLIDQGLIDPERVGIMGYSRGSSMTTFTMSQSKLFRAASCGDSDWFSSNGYWRSAIGRGSYTPLFGGGPWDPKAFENYRAISPSMRGEQFAGPLLQHQTALGAQGATELHMALRDASVPTELRFYRDETHILHNPRRQASAARSTLDWFDYWLLGRKDPDPAKVEQYQRWDAMAELWKAKQAKTAH